jgi:hypothetical protein
MTREPDTNTYCLISWYITSAANLPGGHPVQNALAIAAVEGYLQYDNYKFLRETQEVPNFSVDLLQAVKATLKTITHSKSSINFKDPISSETLQFNKREFWL